MKILKVTTNRLNTWIIVQPNGLPVRRASDNMELEFRSEQAALMYVNKYLENQHVPTDAA